MYANNGESMFSLLVLNLITGMQHLLEDQLSHIICVVLTEYCLPTCCAIKLKHTLVKRNGFIAVL